ncbi:MAG: hypothetical protein ACHP7I_03295 [Terriglobales bacterium]
MRIRSITALLCALVVIGLLGSQNRALAGDHHDRHDRDDRDLPCVGNISDETIKGDLEVPAGATCTLTDVNVIGSIRIDAGGSLSLNGGNVAGNIHGIQASLFFMVPDGGGSPVTVDGNVLMLKVASVEMSRGTVKGNFLVNKSTSIGISGTTFGRNLVVTDTGESIQILGALIGHDFLILGNTGSAFISGNFAHSLAALGNTGGITVVGNTVSGKLVCRANVPPATGQCND